MTESFGDASIDWVACVFIRINVHACLSVSASALYFTSWKRKNKPVGKRPPPRHCIKKKLLPHKAKQHPEGWLAWTCHQAPRTHACGHVHLAESGSDGYMYNSGTQPARGVFLTQACLNSLPWELNPAPEVLLRLLQSLRYRPELLFALFPAIKNSISLTY